MPTADKTADRQVEQMDTVDALTEWVAPANVSASPGSHVPSPIK